MRSTRPRPVAELRAVAKADDELDQADRDLHLAVWEARQAGATWEAIAETLQVSRQAAQKRFRTLERA